MYKVKEYNKKGCFVGGATGFRFYTCSNCQNTGRCWEYNKEYGVFNSLKNTIPFTGFSVINDWIDGMTVQRYGTF